MHLDANDAPPSDPTIALSVVIAAHNAAVTLGAQLDALLAETWDSDWEIVVVDNGSTDATGGLVREAIDRSERVRLVDASDRRGPAYARNVGAQNAQGRSLAFCDADDIVTSGWVAAMGNALGVERFVAGPVELTRLNPAWLTESRGSTGTRAVSRFEDRFPFASSCNLGVDRALFLESDGFEESLQVGEDLDFSMRLHIAGIALEFVPGAVVHYRFRPTMRATFERAVAYGAARPVIAERWRARGGDPISRWNGLRNWAWLVRHLAMLRRRAGRARWLWVAGQRIGSLRGSLRARRLYL